MTDPSDRPASRSRGSRRARGLSLLLLVLAAAGFLWWRSTHPPVAPPQAGPAAPPAPGTGALPPPAGPGYLFCLWNVENLFDDVDDPAQDDPEEDGFARDPDRLRQKLDLVAEALVRLDNGRGPDLRAVVEVETRRAAELLRQALNARLPEPLRYATLIHRDLRTGRRFEPAVITRLDQAGTGPAAILGRALGSWFGGPPRRSVRGPQDFGERRILEARVTARGQPLTLLISHWTSQRTDTVGTRREGYADALLAAVTDRLARDPADDLLLAGDFNAEPTDPAVAGRLRAVGDPARVRLGAQPPWLLNLMAGRDPEQFGTYRFQGRWEILDQAVASPGLLDARGWQVLPETLRVDRDASRRTGRDGRPFRFGAVANDGPRGASDHFAVTVRLRLAPPGPDR